MKIKQLVSLALALCIAAVMSSCARDAHNDIIQIGDGKTAPNSSAENVGFSAQYIRTNGGQDGAKYPVVQIIRSESELSVYYEQHKDEYNLERRKDPAADSTIGFLDACDKYDSAFFEENALVLVLVEEGSGSTRHNVESVSLENNKTQIKINTITPEVGTCDMAQWHIIVELKKTDMPKSPNDIEIYIDGVYRGVEEFVYLYQNESGDPYEPIGYCGNTQTTVYFYKGDVSYTFMYGNSIALTDMLRNLDYSSEMCRCMPEYKIETEFGTYGIKLGDEPYARCSEGQAELTQEQAKKVTEIINWVKDELEREGTLTRSKAIEIAEQNVTVEYEKMSAAFDGEKNIWTVTFYPAQNTLGGDQIIEIGAFGKILSITYGE